MTTLKDIAQKAGVSVSTVSYVLAGKSKTRPETAERIRAIAEEIGYVPNKSAASLRTKKSKTVGVLIPQFATLFFVDVVKAIEDMLYQSGYNMLLATSHNDFHRELMGVQNLLGNHIAGLMITVNDRFREPIPRGLDVPVLRMYESTHEEDCCISVSNHVGGKLAAEHICNRKLHPAACIGYNPYSDTVLERVRSFQNTLAEAGHPLDETLIVGLDDQTFEGGYRGALQLIQQGKPFRSIFACTDNIALGALRALTEHGYKVPKDVAIIGYDNTLVSEMILPSLTTVDMHARDLGKQGARMMINLIENKPILERRLCLIPHLVTREST